MNASDVLDTVTFLAGVVELVADRRNCRSIWAEHLRNVQVSAWYWMTTVPNFCTRHEHVSKH